MKWLMDLLNLKLQEDEVLKLLEPLSRLKQLIAFRYLANLLGVRLSDTEHEIMKEYRKELAKV